MVRQPQSTVPLPLLAAVVVALHQEAGAVAPPQAAGAAALHRVAVVAVAPPQAAAGAAPLPAAVVSHWDQIRWFLFRPAHLPAVVLLSLPPQEVEEVVVD